MSPAGIESGQAVALTPGGRAAEKAAALFFSTPGFEAEAGEKGSWKIRTPSSLPAIDVDVWAVLPDALSNPRRLAIDDLPHVAEQEKNDDRAAAQLVKAPIVIDGMITPGTDRDVFRIRAEAGQAYTICCRSVSLDGSLLPTLTLIDPTGREREHVDNAELDSRLHFVADVSGEYIVAVADRSYRSTSRSFYELEISSRPFIVAAFPTVLQRGTTQRVTLYGYALGRSHAAADKRSGLSQLEVSLDVPKTGDVDGGGWITTPAMLCEGFCYRHPGFGGSAHFDLVDGQVALETDQPNDFRSQAQPVTLPCELAGQFLTRGDVDWYRFSATKGRSLWIEAYGQRSGKAMDLEIAVHDANGKQIDTLTDIALSKKAPPQPLPIETLDPAGAWKPPADGEYYLAVRDLYNTVAAGFDRGYRLSISLRSERVAVAVVSSEKSEGLSVKPGNSASLELFALRHSGHEAPIKIRAEGLPEGVSAKALTIDAKQSTAKWTVTADKNAAAWTGAIKLMAETEVEGKPVVLTVRPTTFVGESKTGTARFCSALLLSVLGPSVKPPASK